MTRHKNADVLMDEILAHPEVKWCSLVAKPAEATLVLKMADDRERRYAKSSPFVAFTTAADELGIVLKERRARPERACRYCQATDHRTEDH